MALPAQKDPDLPDVWLLGLWLALSVFWFFICQGYTPPAHVAYWRETTTIAAGLGLGFTVLLGFTRPAGWLAFLSMVALIYSMPAIGSDSICLFFWIAYYFTVVFSAGNSLTLRKMV
ncbi:MAG: hypothetical protein KIS61_19330, partial [Candidatus Eremiobacteraeota bacterium]|nr:hypothetical protein [Candidatus Eremiobacteraeota bacterium]